MKMFKKVVSAVTASALTLSMAAGSAAMFTSVSAADMTAIELVDDMGNGWNLGNTFDCWGNITWTDQTWTAWGNEDKYLTESLFTSIKNSGFDSVRIPITWAPTSTSWVDSSTYDIDDTYLEKIKTMVDYCYANDMYVIINMHWDWVSDGSQWLNQGAGAKTQFLTMWEEIANYFKDYDNHLVFEDMNEVTFDYSVLNDFNQSFVDTVRATGGNNADRLLLLAGSNTNQEATCNSQFVVPDDDMVAVSIHYYTPSPWCVAEPDSTWGYETTWDIDTQAKDVYDDFNEMANYFVSQGVPVIIGEYGVLNYHDNFGGWLEKDPAEVADYLKTVASAGLNTEGIATFLWDDGTGKHRCFDRSTLTWYHEEVQQVYADLANGDAEVPEGLMLTDRVMYTADTATVEDDGSWIIDITPYRDLANISAVIVNGSISSANSSTAYSGGSHIGFNGFKNGTETREYIMESWYFDTSNNTCIVELDGELTDNDGNVTDTYVIEYDFLKMDGKIWTWSAVDGDTVTVAVDSLTLVFDQQIYVDATTGVVIPEDETTEPTTEEPTTEEPTTEEPTTEPTTEGGTADVKYGDANNDGEVSVADVILVNQAYMKTATLDGTGAANADVDNDGDVDLTDSLNILKSLIDLVTLPIA